MEDSSSLVCTLEGSSLPMPNWKVSNQYRQIFDNRMQNIADKMEIRRAKNQRNFKLKESMIPNVFASRKWPNDVKC